MFRCLATGCVAAVILGLAPNASAQPSPQSKGLRIIPLEGQNALNYLPTRRAIAPVVEVRDENDRAVEGAQVTFKLPDSGPGASFANGAATQTVATDYRGQATAQGYTPNGIPGRFTLQVLAIRGDQAGTLFLTQTNSSKMTALRGEAVRSRKTKWIVLAVLGAAGAGLATGMVSRGGNTPISVSTGPATVGPAR